MKIFHGTTSGIDLGGETTAFVGRHPIAVDPSALSAPGAMVGGRLCRASIVQDGDAFKLAAEGVTSSVRHSDQAAIVLFDCPLVNAEPYSVRPVRGDCRALLSESESYIISSGFSPGAAILTRFLGLVVMEPGSCIEVKESYGRLALLDWFDRWRGIHSGKTRYILRVQVSYDGNAVKIDKLPMERVIS